MSHIDRFRAGLVEYMRMYQIILEATGKEPIMATQVELYKRIKDAMSDDAEVVALCDKFISRSDTQNETTKRNRDMVLRALKEMQYDVDGNFTSKEVARMVTLMNAGESWNVRKAASYLSRLVREGVLRKLEGLPKGTPTTYSWAD